MFTFTIRPDEGEAFKVVATSRDIVVWEKTAGGRTFSDLARASMSDFYGIAFIAARRQGLFEGPRKDFDATVDLEVEEDEEPDPTQPVP